jgi:hypothetical protein
MRKLGDYGEDSDEAAPDYSESLNLPAGPPVVRHRLNGVQETSRENTPSDALSDSSRSSKAELLRGEHGSDFFGSNAAEAALDDVVLSCKDLHGQALLHRLKEIAVLEERDPRRSLTYSNVLQQVLDILVAAVCDVSGGHMWIAVMSDKEFARLRYSVLDEGALAAYLLDATIQDKPFQKRVWFYKSWVEQYDLPVQGGFVVDPSGKILAAAINFLNGTAPLTPAKLARSMREGVVFARSEEAGVKVYPSEDVKKGLAYKVVDASPYDPQIAMLRTTQQSALTMQNNFSVNGSSLRY